MESNQQMWSSLYRLFAGVLLLTVLWGISLTRTGSDPVWVRPLTARPGPVRILRFYATTGSLSPGQTAQLCYSVANAKLIRISPMIEPAYPSFGKCMEIRPDHTTHYTLQAEGFDGTVATRSITLAVQDQPFRTRAIMHVAQIESLGANRAAD